MNRFIRDLIRSTLSLGVITFLIALPMLALAQTPAPGTAAPSFSDVISQALGLVSTWKTAGWLAGCVALVNVLVNLTKVEAIDKWLTGLKIGWWLRPLLAVVLGIIAAVFANLVGGANVGTAILIALLSGLSSTGFHELMTSLFNRRVAAERAAGAKLVDIVKNANGTAEVQVVAMAEELAAITKITDPAAKVAALVAWANAHPVKPEPAPAPAPAPTDKP